MNKKNKQLVILGGGTAGWMAAANFAKLLEQENWEITLIEASNIPSVGVGESTLPTIRGFNQFLGIDELEFVRKTKATFKLGINFEGWNTNSDKQDFFHPFSGYGLPLNGVPFSHLLLKAQSLGENFPLHDFSLSAQMALKKKFAQPHTKPAHPLAHYHYAFQFDASAYAEFLKSYALKRGVQHQIAEVTNIEKDQQGNIDQLIFASGEKIKGDFFIDCSGFQAELIDKAVHVPFENWQQWLPCDRALVAQSEAEKEAHPYTRAIAHDAGWRWRIPLQHRMGNGYVYSSSFLGDDKALELFSKELESQAFDEPRLLKFTTGMRSRFWEKNCAALGLASGFVEPLESTSIALIQAGLSQLNRHFPFAGVNPAAQAEANREFSQEFLRIRDFLILHYKANQRQSGDLWHHCRNMEIPDSLAHKIEVYRYRGHWVNYEAESFEDNSWLTMYFGFGITPEMLDPGIKSLSDSKILDHLKTIRKQIQDAVSVAPGHQDFITRHCGN